jgi:hypothetical protein
LQAIENWYWPHFGNNLRFWTKEKMAARQSAVSLEVTTSWEESPRGKGSGHADGGVNVMVERREDSHALKCPQ